MRTWFFFCKIKNGHWVYEQGKTPLFPLFMSFSYMFLFTGHNALSFDLALLLKTGLNHLINSSSHHHGGFSSGRFQSLGYKLDNCIGPSVFCESCDVFKLAEFQLLEFTSFTSSFTFFKEFLVHKKIYQGQVRLFSLITYHCTHTYTHTHTHIYIYDKNKWKSG